MWMKGPRSVRSVRSPCFIDDVATRHIVEKMYFSYHQTIISLPFNNRHQKRTHLQNAVITREVPNLQGCATVEVIK